MSNQENTNQTQLLNPSKQDQAHQDREDKIKQIVSGNHRPYLPPEIRARNIISLSKDIIRVLQAENEALDRPTSQQLAPIIKEKDGLFKLYDEETDYLAANPNFTKQIPAELRQELKEAAVEFDRMVKENARILQLSLRVSHHVMSVIKDSAARVSGPTKQYGQTGKTAIPKTAPVSFDREL